MYKPKSMKFNNAITTPTTYRNNSDFIHIIIWSSEKGSTFAIHIVLAKKSLHSITHRKQYDLDPIDEINFGSGIIYR